MICLAGPRAGSGFSGSGFSGPGLFRDFLAGPRSGQGLASRAGPGQKSRGLAQKARPDGQH